MRASLVLGLLVAAQAYECPENSYSAYGGNPTYFGMCECDDGYTKYKGNGDELCVPMETDAPTQAPTEHQDNPTPSPTEAPTEDGSSSNNPPPGHDSHEGSSCQGAGPWAGQQSMADWCTMNCFNAQPYCPTSHCDCSGGRRQLGLNEQQQNKCNYNLCKGNDACDCWRSFKQIWKRDQRTPILMFTVQAMDGDEEKEFELQEPVVKWWAYKKHCGYSNKAILEDSCEKSYLALVGAKRDLPSDERLNDEDFKIWQSAFSFRDFAHTWRHGFDQGGSSYAANYDGPREVNANKYSNDNSHPVFNVIAGVGAAVGVAAVAGVAYFRRQSAADRKFVDLQVRISESDL